MSKRYFPDDHTLRATAAASPGFDHFLQEVDSFFHFQLFRERLKKPSSTDFFLALLSLAADSSSCYNGGVGGVAGGVDGVGGGVQLP